MSNLVTVQSLISIGLHNLNRDQNGLPKTAFDGGATRGRISSQALKRAARVAYLSARPEASVRTRDAVGETLAIATAYADSEGLAFDEKAGRKALKSVIDGLAKKEKGEEKEAATDDESVNGDNILLFAHQELEELARAAVAAQQNNDAPAPGRKDLIQDASSPSLDVAAFGRMFAMAPEIGTQAAIAVSHAVTTHRHNLIADYFSAVDDAQAKKPGAHAGAGHIGMAYYTTGTYHRSFTIDIDQLRRSWQSVDGEGARADLTVLVKALITALPTGRRTNSNPDTQPALVLAEKQRYRCVLDFDDPVQAVGKDGTAVGFKGPSVRAFAQKRQAAVAFDPTNFGEARVCGTALGDEDFAAERVENIDGLVQWIVDAVYEAA